MLISTKEIKSLKRHLDEAYAKLELESGAFVRACKLISMLIEVSKKAGKTVTQEMLDSGYLRAHTPTLENIIEWLIIEERKAINERNKRA